MFLKLRNFTTLKGGKIAVPRPRASLGLALLQGDWLGRDWGVCLGWHFILHSDSTGQSWDLSLNQLHPGDLLPRTLQPQHAWVVAQFPLPRTGGIPEPAMHIWWEHSVPTGKAWPSQPRVPPGTATSSSHTAVHSSCVIGSDQAL